METSFTRWPQALGLGVIAGLLGWWLTGSQYYLLFKIPAAFWWWAPIIGISVIVYLSLATRTKRREALVTSSLLVAITSYGLLMAGSQSLIAHNQYLDLLMSQLPLLAWIGVGAFVLYPKAKSPDRFAFLTMSLNILVTGGLLAAVGLVFGGVTLALFQSLQITLPEQGLRLMAAEGLSLVVMVAVALNYNPQQTPAEQELNRGVRPLVTLLMRLFIPLVILVLIVFIGTVPFHFGVPFQNREALVTYNLLLFAVIALLIGVTPVAGEKLNQTWQRWLKPGIMVIAGLTIIISLYALAAVIYRTYWDGITVNRVAIIGWNVVNTGVLVALLISQLRGSKNDWVERLQQTWAGGISWWAEWVVGLIILLPLLFR